MTGALRDATLAVSRQCGLVQVGSAAVSIQQLLWKWQAGGQECCVWPSRKYTLVKLLWCQPAAHDRCAFAAGCSQVKEGAGAPSLDAAAGAIQPYYLQQPQRSSGGGGGGDRASPAGAG